MGTKYQKIIESFNAQVSKIKGVKIKGVGVI